MNRRKGDELTVEVVKMSEEDERSERGSETRETREEREKRVCEVTHSADLMQLKASRVVKPGRRVLRPPIHPLEGPITTHQPSHRPTLRVCIREGPNVLYTQAWPFRVSREHLHCTRAFSSSSSLSLSLSLLLSRFLPRVCYRFYCCCCCCCCCITCNLVTMTHSRRGKGERERKQSLTKSCSPSRVFPSLSFCFIVAFAAARQCSLPFLMCLSSPVN